MSRRLIALVLAVAFASVSGNAFAELPSPSFMPGFPLLAGPQLMIMWQPVPGAAKYIVFINDKKVSESTAFQYIGPAPESSGDYAIEVQAFDAAGAPGKKSDRRVIKVFKLETPKGLVGRAFEGKMSLMWDLVQAALIYNVYRSEDGGKSFTIVSSVQSNNFVDTTIKSGKKYLYHVTAKDATGAESPPSPDFAYEFADTKVVETKKIEQKFLAVKQLGCITSGEFGSIVQPMGVANGPDGNLYVIDSGSARILVLSRDGSLVRKFPDADSGYNVRLGTDLRFGGDGNLYVANNKSFLILTPDGKLIREIKLSIVEGKVPNLNAPGANTLAIGKDGNIYAGDSFNWRIYVISPEGAFLDFINVKGIAGTLSSLRFSRAGNLLFADSLGAAVIEVDRKGKVVRKFGEYGVIAGKIGRANNVFEDAKGNFIVSDSMATLFHVFNKEGAYKFDFGISATKELPVISSFFVDFNEKTRVFTYSQTLNNDVCQLQLPDYE